MDEVRRVELGGTQELPLDPDVDAREDVQHRGEPGGPPFPGARRGRWPRLSRPVLAAVYLGGVAGGLARYAINQAWPTPAAGFPWATFTINTAGAFALALLLVGLAEVLPPSRYLGQLLGTGFLGAFTTFSSVMTATDSAAAHGHPRSAALYLLGSLIAGLGATSFGLLLGRAIAASRHRDARLQPRRRE